MSLHILLVEADDLNDLEELVQSGNYTDIETPIDGMVGFVEASVKVSVQTGIQFDRFEVNLIPDGRMGITIANVDHIRV